MTNTMRELTAEELSKVGGGDVSGTTSPPMVTIPPAPMITINSIDPTVYSYGGGGSGTKMRAPLQA